MFDKKTINENVDDAITADEFMKNSFRIEHNLIKAWEVVNE